MRIPRLYIGQALSIESEVTLGAKASHYLSTVLRMEAGRELRVFNGDGNEYQASIQSAHKKNTVIRIIQSDNINKESPLSTHLAIGVSRGERFDFVLQKATELGITQVTPLHTERTEVKLKGERLQKKMEHWQQILISACEQCQRNVLPTLNPLLTLNDFIHADNNELKLVLHHRSNKTLKEHAPPQSLTLLIGPEGGLSDAEIQQAEAQKFHALTLGPRVLRTETAPITALSTVQFLWGDL